MRFSLVVAGVLFGLAAGSGRTSAHPGHDHSNDCIVFLSHDSPPLDTTLQAPIVLAMTGIAMTAGMLLVSKPRKRAVVAAGAILAGSAFVAAFECTDASANTVNDEHPQQKKEVKDIERLFEHFKKDAVSIRSDKDYFYVESNAFPKHPMMIGITAWQQQVPLPQPYIGKNSWRIPLRPVVAEKPISAKKALYRGAIALAVNGVPIFNALNNRGEDAFLASELDEYGGHCGRGDDYHYHVAPLHLEKVVGKGQPIAFALDGFPIYGTTDADGKEPANLDELNGRFEKDGSYRYYSSKKYPYINGGMRGVVSVRGDQIDPQPRDAPVRPAGQPLRGAKITDFTRDDEKKTYTLKYDLRGKAHTLRYTINDNGSFTFVAIDPEGKENTETYRRRPNRD